MSDSLNPLFGSELQELGLKYKNESELFDNLLSYGQEWSTEQLTAVTDAYHLARLVHAEDRYKSQEPYIYHLLRVANRVAGYLHLNDPDMIVAALLHDSVEDRPKELLAAVRPGMPIVAPKPDSIPEDPATLQDLAFRHIGAMFSARTAAMVASVTNEPKIKGRQESYQEWLQRYARKVENAARTPEGWAIKFCDWSDNGLGVIYSEEPVGSDKRQHFERKYGMALVPLERRFYDDDIQAMLDPQARALVANQFRLGRERLSIPGMPA